MNRKLIFLLCIVSILFAGNIIQFIWNSSQLFSDAVPNEETALLIAEAVLGSVYGEDTLYTKPYSGTYDRIRNAWIITGNLPEPTEGQLINGGVPEIVIGKRDGKILKMYHGM